MLKVIELEMRELGFKPKHSSFIQQKGKCSFRCLVYLYEL